MQQWIESSWASELEDEFDTPYWKELVSYVEGERLQHGDEIYPAEADVFAAFERTPFDDVRVLLLGQDPYHGPGQAHGLSFSVPQGVKLPPSLRNIFREMSDDLAVGQPEHGCLSSWADQGVLLLNTVLTVRRGEANSHRKRGWEQFTDAVVAKLAQRDRPLVFLLWGGPARKKLAKIDTSRHPVISSVHPSPLSAYRGFFGSRPFSQVNAALKSLDAEPINWQFK